MINLIGENAGKIWRYLNENGEGSSLKHIMAGTKLSRDEVHTALGWLAREGKINIGQKGKTKQRSVHLVA